MGTGGARRRRGMKFRYLVKDLKVGAVKDLKDGAVKVLKD